MQRAGSKHRKSNCSVLLGDGTERRNVQRFGAMASSLSPPEPNPTAQP